MKAYFDIANGLCIGPIMCGSYNGAIYQAELGFTLMRIRTSSVIIKNLPTARQLLT